MGRPVGRPKGTPKTGGRGKGVANRATYAAREAIGLFVDGNAHRLQAWLDEIAADDPVKAFELFQSVIEYHVPKLARTEVTGEGGGPVIIQSTPTDDQL
jgi:hypothetical protein